MPIDADAANRVDLSSVQPRGNLGDPFDGIGSRLRFVKVKKVKNSRKKVKNRVLGETEVDLKK
jgi:hypothetical protein